MDFLVYRLPIMQVTGPFEVNMQPLESANAGQEGITLGRMSIEKSFSGELSGASRGEMLMARTPVESSAGYVAIEQVSGSLSGKQGTFVLQHFGVMSSAGERLILEVVPDSGTGELTGLRGQMEIKNDKGQHSYIFDYQLG